MSEVDGMLPEPMPPWFARVMESCESLALDDPRDRTILWERISEAWPHLAIEAAISDQMPPRAHEDVEACEARIKAAVIAALEEA